MKIHCQVTQFAQASLTPREIADALRDWMMKRHEVGLHEIATTAEVGIGYTDDWAIANVEDAKIVDAINILSRRHDE